MSILIYWRELALTLVPNRIINLEGWEGSILCTCRTDKLEETMKLYSEFFVLKSESGPILTSWDIGCSLAISISYIFLVVPQKVGRMGSAGIWVLVLVMLFSPRPGSLRLGNS